MDIVSIKILVGACFGIIRFLTGLLPFFIYKWLEILNEPPKGSNINKKKREEFVESAFLPFQSFSGGALFAACLLHMIPNVNQAVADIKSFGLLDTEYPFSQLIVSSGFFLVYFLEEISQYILLTLFKNEEDFKNKKKRTSSASRSVGKSKIGQISSRERFTTSFTKTGQLPSVRRISVKDLSSERKLSVKAREQTNRRLSPVGRLSPIGGYLEDHKSKLVTPTITSNNEISIKPGSFVESKNGISYEINFIEDDYSNLAYFDLYKRNKDDLNEQKLNGNAIKQNSSSSSKKSGNISPFSQVKSSEEELELKELIQVSPTSRQQILRYVLVVLALSSHAIFEGIAIGLQRSVANTWYLLVALSIHSASNLFAIGLDLVKEKTTFKTIIIQVFVIAVTSPLGVYIGLGINLTTTKVTVAESVALVVLEGLSTGTIFYIVFFEVLRREKELRTYRFKRGLCIGAGFALLAYLQYSEVSN